MERFVDGQADRAAVIAAERETRQAHDLAWRQGTTAWNSAGSAAIRLLSGQVGSVTIEVGKVLRGPKASCEAVSSVRATLIPFFRDIFGNPFRPVSFSPEWRTDTALSLAKQMYESRDFSAMPILADAIQDAGCDSEDILNHCRDANQPHVRGCWVVDLVLGKE
jgi:hypothetical protein